MMRNVVERGHRHGGAARGRRRRRQDRHGRGRRDGTDDLWFIGFTDKRRGRRRWSSARPAARAATVAAPIAAEVLKALGELMHGVERDTIIDGRYRVIRRGSAPAGWPTSTAPRTSSSAAAWR